MRRLLIAILLFTQAWAEPPVSSYEYQGPPLQRRNLTRRYPTRSHSMRQRPVVQTTSSYSGFDTAQRPAPLHLSNWGGTVVSSGQGPVTITSNGSIPANSVVCIGRGNEFVGQGRILQGNLVQTDGLETRPGDWVSLVSIPQPQPQRQTYTPAQGYYHPTSTNADPRYQQWLRQGFTLGRRSSRPYSRNPYRTRF